jgi:predicted phosphodiesterase
MRLMRVGLMSDLHGNSIAVRRVLEDGQRRGVERWWILGDIVALGPDPVGVLELLFELPDVSMIGGNTERYVLTGDRPYPSFDDVKANHELMPQLIEVATSFAWTRGMLTQAGWLSWLASLPRDLRWTLPDGTRVLGVHASPRSDDGDGIRGSPIPIWNDFCRVVMPMLCSLVTRTTPSIDGLAGFGR